MIKDFIIYSVVFITCYFIGLYTHQEILAFSGNELRFSLARIYLFHAFFSGLICINLRLASNAKSLSTQLGLLYLSTFVIKLLLFGIYFYKPLLDLKNITFPERFSLLIPLFIFLIIEVLFVIKILNNKDKKQFNKKGL